MAFLKPPYEQDPSDIWLCVDPGVSGTGWAIFRREFTTPTAFGVLVVRDRASEWLERARGAVTQFSRVLRTECPGQVIIEFQEMYASGVSVAAGFKGDLFKLTLITGALACASWQFTGRTPILKTPREWKGQLPKDVVEKRVRAHYARIGEPWPNVPNHAMDAIGIGFSLRGLL